MSFDDDFAADALPDIYAATGVDGTVTRVTTVQGAPASGAVDGTETTTTVDETTGVATTVVIVTDLAAGTVVTTTTVVAPLRLVVDRNQERLGEFGRVIGRVDRVRCQTAQWTLQQGDTLAWTDRLGAHSKRVESQAEDDGLESYGVLHG